MRKIQKLNQLLLSESFMQVNYSHGFKYIDKAGEILNRYAEDKKIPKNNISVDGLSLNKPKKDIEALKVSGTQFWCHFIKPVNLGHIEEIFQKELEANCNIIGPSKVTRVGWRNYFILQNVSEQDTKKIFKNGAFLSKQLTLNLVMTGKLGEFEAKLEVNPLRQKGTSEKGILFDIDIFSTEMLEEAEGVKTVLIDIRKTLDEKLPKMINKAVKNA